MIILVVLLCLAGAYWLYWASHARRMDKITASLPSPPGLPLIGNATLFMGDTEQILKNIQDLAAMAHKHKGSIKIWLGPKLYVAIGNPEDAQVILENCLEKDVVYRFLRPWLGHGLFIAPVGLWKAHRKVLLPVFHNKIVEEYLGVIGEQSSVLVERLSEQTGNEEFDVLKYITACTLDIVFETAMGERMDVQHTPDTPYLRARNTVMTILNKRLFKVWLQPDCLFNLTPYAKQQKDNIDLTHKFTDEVVKKKRVEYERQKNGFKNTDENTAKSTGKLRAVLDMLFGREIEFTNEQLREHIDSITIAGNDTTALVIAYTLVLLGAHQDVQEKAYREQESIFGNSKRGATKDDLQKMQYLERVIKESMRLYTVVPIIARNIDRDTYLPGCGATIPAGAGAVIGAFAIHRYEAVWGPDADQFDPERFLQERSANRHPAAFIPFSYGSRNCIGSDISAQLHAPWSRKNLKNKVLHGRNFGMLIIKSIVSSVVRSYKIQANKIERLKIEMLLFPINGHLVKIYKR